MTEAINTQYSGKCRTCRRVSPEEGMPGRVSRGFLTKLPALLLDLGGQEGMLRRWWSRAGGKGHSRGEQARVEDGVQGGQGALGNVTCPEWREVTGVGTRDHESLEGQASRLYVVGAGRRGVSKLRRCDAELSGRF